MKESTPTGRIAAVRDRAVTVRDDLEKRLGAGRERFWFVDTAVQAFERDSEVGGFVLAGAIAFRLFVYLLPMFLLVLVAAVAAFSVDPEGSERVGMMSGLSGYVIDTLSDATETSRRSMWILVPATLWALVVAGRSVFRVIALAHANAWRRPSRPAGATAALEVVVFALACVAATSATRYLRSEGYVVPATGLSVVLYTGLWLVASWRLPRDPAATWIDLLPGALLVAAGTQGLYLFNVLYLQRKVASASEAYGALGIAASGLLWLYLLGRLLVAAPVLNAVMRERRVSLASDST